ncbi:MAG TPA: AAA family ATPase [Planctomycetota bacterium]|nr:AAA family ATPase [Planctomycetota bacterium]
MTPQPEAILIAGANGAGKTTFARQFLRVRYPTTAFLNADEIQREDSAFAHPVAAGRELLRRLDEFASLGKAFAVETTLSGRSYTERLRRWARSGYETSLHFIELPSADYAVQRVATRVAAGGHDVREADIRRRFDRGLLLFSTAYKAMVDRWYHWFSDDQDSDLSTTNTTSTHDSELEIMLEAARRATWDALHGPRHLRSGRFHPSDDDGHGGGEAAQLYAAADEVREDTTEKPNPSRAPRR